MPWWTSLLVNTPGRIALSGRVCLDRGSLDLGDVRLVATRPVEVQVRGDEGGHVSGAGVTLYATGAGSGDSIGWQQGMAFFGTTNGDGRLEFTNVPSGSQWSYRLRVDHPDYALHVAPYLNSTEQACRAVVLTRGRTVRGRVLDADGALAVGHVIEAARGTSTSSHVCRGFELARTDTEGRFSIRNLPLCEFALVVGTRTSNHPFLHIDSALKPMPLIVHSGPAEAVTDLGVIRIPSPRRVQGIVVNEEGVPQGRVTVSVEAGLHDDLWLTGTTTSDAGRFELRVPDLPGLSVRAQAHLGPAAGARSKSVPLLLPGDELEVVVSHKGTVLLRFVKQQQPAEEVAPKVWIDGELQPDGRWRCGSVRLRALPGKHTIRVMALGRSPRLLEGIVFDPEREVQLEVHLLGWGN